MCSIIGVYSKGKDISEEALNLMQSLKHRGPESFGFKTPKNEAKTDSIKNLKIPNTKIFLGHCLLSTTGYASQPITSNNVSVSHNGQIYNFEEFGFPNNSSDSGVVANFFAQELEKNSFQNALKKFFEKAVGEYAIGILYKEKLFTFRDLLGVKPIWFGENDSLYAFASEPSALMKIDIQFPQPLKPGHLLEISKSGLKETEIFDLNEFKKTIPKNYSIKNLKKEFDTTIHLQTKNLEKTAVLFSGGIDSSLIAKAVSQKVPNTKLFVAGTKESHDLLEAKKVAEQLQIPLEAIELNENDIQSLSLKAMKILSIYDEMQIGISVPELACAEKIKEQGYKVVFSGQGSDEVFCGYNNFSKILESSGYKGVEEEIWFSLSRMWSRNFYRDDIIIASQSLELRVPLVSLNFLKEAMAFPAEQKIKNKNDVLRKHPIRELARLYDLPNSTVLKPKKAMQYGSGSQKIVSKLFK